MNEAKRKMVAGAIKVIEQARDVLEDVRNDEQFIYDHTPKSQRYSDDDEARKERIRTLNEFLNALNTDGLLDIVNG